MYPLTQGLIAYQLTRLPSKHIKIHFKEANKYLGVIVRRTDGKMSTTPLTIKITPAPYDPLKTLQENMGHSTYDGPKDYMYCVCKETLIDPEVTVIASVLKEYVWYTQNKRVQDHFKQILSYLNNTVWPAILTKPSACLTPGSSERGDEMIKYCKEEFYFDLTDFFYYSVWLFNQGLQLRWNFPASDRT